jgi:hypothetical protein
LLLEGGELVEQTEYKDLGMKMNREGTRDSKIYETIKLGYINNKLCIVG